MLSHRSGLALHVNLKANHVEEIHGFVGKSSKRRAAKDGWGDVRIDVFTVESLRRPRGYVTGLLL